MTWAQSIANEKLSIFAEATRVPKAHWETLWCEFRRLTLAESASKVGVKFGFLSIDRRLLPRTIQTLVLSYNVW